MALTKVSRGLLSTGIVDNSNATAITIDSSENVLVNTANAGASGLSLSNGSNLSFAEGANSSIANLFRQTSSANAFLGSGYRFSATANKAESSYASSWARTAISVGYGAIKFYADAAATVAVGTDITPTERMRIDASGNVGIGATTYEGSVTSNASSVWISPAGYLSANINNDWGLGVNRTGTDGTLINLRKNGADVGRIGNSGTRFVVHGTYTGGAGLYFGSNVVLPTNNAGALSDGAVSLGQSNYRYNTIFAAAGSINTSDRNEKQDIEALSDAEQRVAVAAKGLMRKYRWKSAVAEKGDNARIHVGIIAQDLQDAFTAEGLDAARYGMWCSDTWWETQTEVAAVEATEDTEAVDAYTRTDTYDTQEEAPEGATEQTRLGVRYSELLAFIISAI